MKIVWDEPKRLANLAKHGLDFASLDPTFFDRAQIIPAKNGRWKATARLGGRRISVIFAFLGREGISIVSMRPANRKELEGSDDQNT